MVTCIKKSHELFYKNLKDIKTAAKRNQTDHIDSLWAFRLLFSVSFLDAKCLYKAFFNMLFISLRVQNI